MRKHYPYRKGITELRGTILSFLLLFDLFLCSNTLVAQEGFWHPVYKNYTTTDGFSSMEGYASIQDKDGYMWFATDRGVARFNGEEFKIFTTSDGLISNTIFKIAEDDKGRMWFLSNGAQLCYYENGRITSYQFNDKLEAHYKGHGIITYTSWKFKNDEVMISTSFADPIHIDKKGNVTLPQNNAEQYKESRMTIFLHDGELMTINNHDNLISPRIIIDIDGNRKTSVDFFNSYNNIGKHACVGWLDENSIYYSESQNLITSNRKSTKKYSFESTIINISKIKNTFWIAFIGGGIKRFLWKNDSLILDKHLFQDKIITSAFEDDEGHLWFTSMKSGIFKVSDEEISRLNGFSEFEETINHIGREGERIFISSNRGGFHVYNNALGKMETLPGQPTELLYNGILQIPRTNEILFIPNSPISSFCQFKENRFEMISRPFEVLSALRIDERTLLIGNHKGVYRKGETGLLKLKSIPNGVRQMEYKSDYCLWLANYGPMKVMDLETKTISDPSIKILQQRMNDIQNIDDYTLFGTNGNGLIFKKGETITLLNTLNGFPRNFITKIRQGEEGSFWALGYDGITQIKKDDNGTFLYRDYPAARMMTERLNDFTVGENFIYLATNNGLVRIDSKFDFSDIPPRLHLIEIEVNGMAQKIEDISIPYSSNNLLIKFDAVSFENRPVVFRFRSHSSDDWTIITERFVRLSSLSSGSYQFEIQASLDQEEWVSSERINITILPPFWKTKWFIFIVIVLIVALITLLIVIRIRSVKRKYKEQQKILQMQQEALSQQMNPHFIFNALGSVQNSILKGETLLANSYLVKFSKLLRTGLNASRAELISIKQDSELMRNYLNVEQTRMKKSFAFSVLIESKSPSSTLMIPPFLLQPFVENAIKHGFSDELSDFYILVKYQQREKDIRCSISDTGVGRNAKRNSSGAIEHESHGMDIAFQRILLINKTKGFTSHIDTIDLRDKDNNSSGTEVVFTIPIIKQ